MGGPRTDSACYKCGECEDFFIGYSHLKYHIETQHDARCADCCMFCNRTCSIQYAMKTELTDERAMEDGITEKRDAVADAMDGLEQCVKEKIARLRLSCDSYCTITESTKPL